MENKINIIEDLEFRGLINQSTDLGVLKKALEKPITLYAGFDPTADSLHVGSLLLVLTLRRFQEAGHKPIVLVGGATGLIGDPSGKTAERPLSPAKKVKEWAGDIKNQLEQFLDFGFDKAQLVNNYDWLSEMKIIPFLRDIGKNFSVNSMIAKESVKKRLETGISFTEFNYQVLQACDYLNLFEKYGCRLQIGGSDQWGNITAGVDLIRRVKREEVYALSIPLVTKADGTKFGKTETETVWLSSKKTTPYEFYQFWINIDDREVVKLLKYFTFLSQEKIEKLGQQVKDNPAEREAQRVLAREVTEITHGKEATARAEKISDALFYGNIRELNKEEIKEGFKNVSSYEIKNKNELELVELLVEAGVVSSKRQAREDIKNGAIYINGKQEMDTGKILQFSDRLFGEYIVIRRGKRSYYVIRWY